MRPLKRKRIEIQDNGCHIWHGAKNPHGYGCINLGGKMRLAHRVMFEIHYGRIPKGYYICHKCDTPPCVNPEHMFLGTQQDNINDSKAKNRINRGEKNPTSILKESQVLEAYKQMQAGISTQEMANRYGVSKGCMDSIKGGKSWSHVTGHKKLQDFIPREDDARG